MSETALRNRGKRARLVSTGGTELTSERAATEALARLARSAVHKRPQVPPVGDWRRAATRIERAHHHRVVVDGVRRTARDTGSRAAETSQVNRFPWQRRWVGPKRATQRPRPRDAHAIVGIARITHHLPAIVERPPVGRRASGALARGIDRDHPPTDDRRIREARHLRSSLARDRGGGERRGKTSDARKHRARARAATRTGALKSNLASTHELPFPRARRGEFAPI